jgi:hypothetical protein
MEALADESAVALNLHQQCTGKAGMGAAGAGHRYAIEERFEKALKLVRAVLTTDDLEIVGELDMPPGCRVLLVDCPLLLFEGLALDRAAGVYFPLHVVVASDGARTYAATVKPGEVFEARLPAGAAEPFKRLEGRVALALASLVGTRRGKRKKVHASVSSHE